MYTRFGLDYHGKNMKFDDAIKEIETNDNLRFIEFYGTNLGGPNHHMYKLFDVLQHKKNIIGVTLNDNALDDPYNLGRLLSENKHIIHFNVSNNFGSRDISFSHFFLGLGEKQLKTLIISSTNFSYDTDLGVLCNFLESNPLIETLELVDNNAFVRNERNPNFLRLINILKNNINLKVLSLNNGVPDNIVGLLLENVKQNDNIEYLNISHNTFGKNDDIMAILFDMLKTNKRLRTLIINWIQLKDGYHLLEILSIITNVDSCMISILKVGNNKYFIDKKTLKDIQYGLRQALYGNTKLKKLSLNDNGFDDVALDSFSHILLENETLQYIDIFSYDYTEKGVAKLLMSLKHNASVKQIKISKKHNFKFSQSYLDEKKRYEERNKINEQQKMSSLFYGLLHIINDDSGASSSGT